MFWLRAGALSRGPVLVAVVFSLWLIPFQAFGQEPWRRSTVRRVVPVETRFAPTVVVQGSESLGTFEPTPYVNVRGNGETGGGYSPLGIFGEQTMVLYGPMAVERSVTAPVTTYSRGYDGTLHEVPGYSFSKPNMPALSPVVYPTRSSNYYRSRFNLAPPSRPRDSMNWIDQN